MWWVMMREPAAVQRHDSERAEKACKQKKVPINSLTVLTHRQDTNTQIAQDRKEDSNTLITCRTRSQRVKDKRGSHKCSFQSRILLEVKSGQVKQRLPRRVTRGAC